MSEPTKHEARSAASNGLGPARDPKRPPRGFALDKGLNPWRDSLLRRMLAIADVSTAVLVALSLAVFPGGTLRQLRTLRSSRTFLCDSDGLASLAASMLRAQTFDQLCVPFGAVATDAETAAPVLLTRGLVVPAIVASAAIPGIFPPV